MATRLGALIGVQDGANHLFATSTPYTSGSVAVRKNGTTLSSGVSEIDPGDGLISLAVAPILSDIVVAAYVDPDPVGPGSLQSPIVAFVQQVAELSMQGAFDFFLVAGQSGSLFAGTIFDKNGQTFNLTGSTLYFQARKDSEAGAIVFDKTSLAPSPKVVVLDQTQAITRGRFEIVFSSAETQAAKGMILRWDFWIKVVTSANLVPLVKGGTIEVRAAVRSTFP